MIGSPAVKFRSTVHGKLKSLAMINLKILFTFMLWVALEKKRVAFITFAYALACMYTESQKLVKRVRQMKGRYIIFNKSPLSKVVFRFQPNFNQTCGPPVLISNAERVKRGLRRCQFSRLWQKEDFFKSWEFSWPLPESRLSIANLGEV